MHGGCSSRCPATHHCYPALLPCTAASQVIAVIASVGSVAAPYILPALFGLVLLPDLHPMERWLLKTIVPVRCA